MHPIISSLCRASSFHIILSPPKSKTRANGPTNERTRTTGLSTAVPLQVVDGPDPEGDGQGDSAEAENEDGGVSAVQGGTDPVPDLLGVPAARSRALRTAESWSLLFEVHPGALGLRQRMKRTSS